jgi:hypothetical protein
MPKDCVMAHTSEFQLGSSPLFRYAAAPVAAFLAVEAPLVLVTEPKPIGVFVLIGLIEAMCAAFIVGAWSPPNLGSIAFRISAGLLSLICLASLVANVANIVAPALNPFPAKDVNLVSMFPFLMVGLPCLWYAAFGRFGSAAHFISVGPQTKCGSDQPSKDRPCS